MENRFNMMHKIPYDGIRPDFTLSFTKLMSMFQETTIAHTNSTPLPLSWYADNNMGFLLTNWDVFVNRHPPLYDEVTVYTWPVYFKGITAERSFVMRDKYGNEAAAANTRWVFADLEKRRPLKIPEDVSNAYAPTFSQVFEPNYTFPKTDGFEQIGEARITALRSDIDTHFHVNNVKYIEWAFNYIPEELYFSGNVYKMKARYKKELKSGEKTLLETWRKDDEIISLIKSEDDAAVLHASLYFIFTIS